MRRIKSPLGDILSQESVAWSRLGTVENQDIRGPATSPEVAVDDVTYPSSSEFSALRCQGWSRSSAINTSPKCTGTKTGVEAGRSAMSRGHRPGPSLVLLSARARRTNRHHPCLRGVGSEGGRQKNPSATANKPTLIHT